MNILAIYLLLYVIFNRKPSVNNLAVILLFLAFEVHTYVRYVYRDDNSVEVIEKKMAEKK